MTDAPTTPEALDVLIATPLEPELVARVAEADPRIRVIHEPGLLPPMRWSGDHAGDPGFRRGAEGEETWAKLLASADVWFGTPRGDPAVLRDVLPRCPRLKFIQGTAAGEAQLVAASGLDGDTLRRVAITTAAGIHAVPLAEFAILGLLALAKDVRGLERAREARRWPTTRRPPRELRGATVLILRLGGLGAETARLASALGIPSPTFLYTYHRRDAPTRRGSR